MDNAPENALVVLGPTASGKTALGVGLARAVNGEILSADSREVYVGLDLCSGKDLHEYREGGAPVPYHLIDIAPIGAEFSVFHYQQAFYRCFEDVLERGRMPVIVGGTGLYLDAALRGYRMVEAPENPALRRELAGMPMAALADRLCALKPALHNTTDLQDRARLIRAIEIAEYARDHAPPPAPEVRPLIFGAAWPRPLLRRRIAARLRARLDAGMVEEVERLHEGGCTWERLEELGLECRFIAAYLQRKIRNRNDLFQKLCAAIVQFARRQETWFRRMERQGIKIHWIPQANPEEALDMIRRRAAGGIL